MTSQSPESGSFETTKCRERKCSGQKEGFRHSRGVGYPTQEMLAVTDTGCFEDALCPSSRLRLRPIFSFLKTSDPFSSNNSGVSVTVIVVVVPVTEEVFSNNS